MTAPGQSGDGDGGEEPVRDAACLVLVDRSADEPRLLLGRRRATQVFLPNKWVFPGGRVDTDDHALAALAGDEAQAPAVAAGHAPFAWAAVRETFEETGILVGGGTPLPAALPAAWQHFAALGAMPGISGLKPLARAITPPGFPRRFDTWFYLADWQASHPIHGTPDGELLDLGWFTLAGVRALDLAIITRLIVDDVAIALGLAAEPEEAGIPFYFQDVDGYRRTLLASSRTVASP